MTDEATDRDDYIRVRSQPDGIWRVDVRHSRSAQWYPAPFRFENERVAKSYAVEKWGEIQHVISDDGR